jgi:hypothetical protein
MHLDGAIGWVVAEQRSQFGYVRNIETNPMVRVCLQGRWQPARVRIVTVELVDLALRAAGSADEAEAPVVLPRRRRSGRVVGP